MLDPCDAHTLLTSMLGPRRVAAEPAAVAELGRMCAYLAQAKLLEHKGVGPWTAHYVGLRALGHLDCLPAADVGLQKAIQRFYRLRRQPSAGRVEKLARNWSGWRSYATFYLWLTFWEDATWKEAFLQEVKSERRSSRP